MKISKKMEDALNGQIKKELDSEYIYLAMSAYCTDQNLNGFAKWFDLQAKEEHVHAMKIFKYIQERRGRAKVPAIAEPTLDFGSIEKAAETQLSHEEFITKSIYELVDLANAEKDHATVEFLQWYVEEQVEEEAQSDDMLQKVKMANGNVNAIMMIDSIFGRRSGE